MVRFLVLLFLFLSLFLNFYYFVGYKYKIKGNDHVPIEVAKKRMRYHGAYIVSLNTKTGKWYFKRGKEVCELW